ncbi:MAG: LPS export ABC transporter periplasmic protein LptC [Gammaproteobacteria bacterium]
MSDDKLSTPHTQRGRRRQPLLILLAIVCGGTFWFANWDSERQPHLSPSTALPDFVINNFISHTYTETGKRLYQLSATKLTHYEKTDESYLDDPEFRAEPGTSQQGWRATAEQGIAAGGANHINLQQNVTLITDGTPLTTYRVYTDNLDLYPNQQLARTDSKVRVTQADHYITSTGFDANWGIGELILTQDVKSHYEATR